MTAFEHEGSPVGVRTPERGGTAMPSILIVEDELLLAKGLANYLRNFGYETAGIVTTGEDAIRRVEEQRPDLILMDVQLGDEIDGIKAAELIRKRFDVPIVYLTGFTEADVIERAKKTHPYGYLSKPVGVAELRSTIETALYKYEADKKVRESENRYFTLIETMAEGVLLQDRQYVIRSFNQAAERMLRVSAEDVLGKVSCGIAETCIREDGSPYPPEDHPSTLTLIDGRPRSGIVMGIVHDDETVWISINTRPLFEPGEELPHAVVVSFSDITRLKKAEEVLRESESRFRSLVENIPNVPVQGYDEHRTVVFWNRASENLYGYCAEEAMGKKLEDLIIPPHMRDKVIRGMQDWLYHGCTVKPAELELMRKDGSRVPVYSSHAMIENHRDEKEFYCIDVDLTELKQAESALEESEERYRQVVENARQAIFVVQDGRFTFNNSHCREISGYTSEELVSKSLEDFIHPGDRDYVLSLHRKRLEGDNTPYSFTARFVDKYGKVIRCHMMTVVIPWEGRPASLCFLSDISAIKWAEEWDGDTR